MKLTKVFMLPMTVCFALFPRIIRMICHTDACVYQKQADCQALFSIDAHGFRENPAQGFLLDSSTGFS